MYYKYYVTVPRSSVYLQWRNYRVVMLSPVTQDATYCYQGDASLLQFPYFILVRLVLSH